MSRDSDFSGIVQWNPFKSIVCLSSCDFLLYFMVVCDLQMSRKYKLYLLYSLSSFCDFLPSATVMKSPDVVSLSRERVSSAYSFGGHYPTLGKTQCCGQLLRWQRQGGCSKAACSLHGQVWKRERKMLVTQAPKGICQSPEDLPPGPPC